MKHVKARQTSFFLSHCALRATLYQVIFGRYRRHRLTLQFSCFHTLFYPITSRIRRPLLLLPSLAQSYPCFLVKWIILQLLTISGSVSFLIFTVVQKELDLTQQLTTEVYVWFAVIGLLQIVSRVAPPCNSLIIDQLKGSLQVAHGTSVIKKIFEMEQ